MQPIHSGKIYGDGSCGRQSILYRCGGFLSLWTGYVRNMLRGCQGIVFVERATGGWPCVANVIASPLPPVILSPSVWKDEVSCVDQQQASHRVKQLRTGSAKQSLFRARWRLPRRPLGLPWYSPSCPSSHVDASPRSVPFSSELLVSPPGRWHSSSVCDSSRLGRRRSLVLPLLFPP